MIALLVGVLFAFSDYTSCIVQGHVYNMSDVATFRRVDSCPGVDARVDGEQIELHSPNAWVVIRIPPTRGQERLQYTWGREHAYIEGKPIEIQWGYLVQG